MFSLKSASSLYLVNSFVENNFTAKFCPEYWWCKEPRGVCRFHHNVDDIFCRFDTIFSFFEVEEKLAQCMA